MLRMGHDQRLEDLNLGLGWIYYGLGRIIRPKRSLCIGSYRGFVPSIMAKSMLDNSEKGELIFIDPSLADDFWEQPQAVKSHFDGLGVNNIIHHKYTTQDFLNTDAYKALNNIGFLMVDGYHTAEQARFDYLAFADKLTDDAIVMFHDSKEKRKSTFYGEEKAYEHDVCDFMKGLKNIPGIEIFNFPIASGVTIMRGRPDSLDLIRQLF